MSDVLTCAENQGPQHITRHGQEVAVVGSQTTQNPVAGHPHGFQTWMQSALLMVRTLFNWIALPSPPESDPVSHLLDTNVWLKLRHSTPDPGALA